MKGFAAVAYQATVSNVQKGTVFALLESAAARGYGAVTVNAIAQGGAVLGQAVMAGKAMMDKRWMGVGILSPMVILRCDYSGRYLTSTHNIPSLIIMESS